MTSDKIPDTHTFNEHNSALITEALNNLSLNPARAAGNHPSQGAPNHGEAQGSVTISLTNLIDLLHGCGVNVISPMEEIINMERAQAAQDAQDTQEARDTGSALNLLPAQRAFIFGTGQKNPCPWTVADSGAVTIAAASAAQAAPAAQLALTTGAAPLAAIPATALPAPAGQLAAAASVTPVTQLAATAFVAPVTQLAAAASVTSQPAPVVAQSAPVAQPTPVTHLVIHSTPAAQLLPDSTLQGPPTSPTTGVPGPSNIELGAGVDPSITGFVCTSCHTYNTIRSARETYYCVIAGRAVGVFQGWHNVQPLVSGVGHACYKKYPSEADALAAFEEAQKAGYVVVLA
ncbi:hypothetical protein BJ912DRAFT_925171 [Pholiota molesta]|nr:hypothetical protein BJ912DRAFT_925171 [Pholiota molesta]